MQGCFNMESISEKQYTKPNYNTGVCAFSLLTLTTQQYVSPIYAVMV